MQDLQTIELSDLFDMLAQQTSQYVKMLSNGATQQEFDHCRQVIIDIQMEIEWRKRQRPNTTATNKNISFSGDRTRTDRPKSRE